MTIGTAVPRIGVGAVIVNERAEILLVWRNRQPEKDTWSIPGGQREELRDSAVCAKLVGNIPEGTFPMGIASQRHRTSGRARNVKVNR
ncbi:hypothetical protein GCM10023228_36310 [Brevibacillus fulvus]|uniref:Nudix hydrolase domain-containing protein n=1 Tax=Brevibacillus fulvus TaxID=1125967 RepID=A0A938XXB2_9BACL|nr:hypothetical protein [Brevibacillus fulvus]